MKMDDEEFNLSDYPGTELLVGDILSGPASALAGVAVARPMAKDARAKAWDETPRGAGKSPMRHSQMLDRYLSNHPWLAEHLKDVNLSAEPFGGVMSKAYHPESNTVHAASRGLPGILHEIGHAKADDPISKLRYATAKSFGRRQPASGLLNQIIQSIETAPQRALNDIVLTPWNESVAWKKAFDMAGDRPALKKMMLKSMLPGLGSYLTHGGLRAAGLGLMGKGIYDMASED